MASSQDSPTRVESVVTLLRQGVFEGKYPPGSPLRELSLARELSVSQATVREALQQLQHTGLVTRKPNVGSSVTRLSVKEVRERVELRALLEVKAALEASRNMGPAEFEELERRRESLNASVESDRYYEAAQADLHFHRYIWECSRNETVCRHLELLTVPLFAFMSILRSQGLERLARVVEDHSALIAALRSQDPGMIRSEFHKMATNSYQSFLGRSPERAVLAAFGLIDASPQPEAGPPRASDGGR
jgi:DNA-binding GntR family transcriptional regulator